MKNQISFESLFSSKSVGSSLQHLNKMSSNKTNFATYNPNSIKSASSRENSAFSNMLNKEVRRTENESDNQIQDSTVKTKEPKVNKSIGVKNAKKVSMTESEQNEMVKEVEELYKKAETLIDQICNLLGIDVENAQNVVAALFMDDKLVSGENAQFLTDALSSGAKNIPQIKMQEIVALLEKTYDYLASSKELNPEDTLVDEMVAKDIAKAQNELKHIKVDVNADSGKDNLVDFAKVVKAIKDSASNSVEPTKSDVKAVAPKKNADTENVMSRVLNDGTENAPSTDTNTKEAVKAETKVTTETETEVAPQVNNENQSDKKAPVEASFVPEKPLSDIGKSGFDTSKKGNSEKRGHSEIQAVETRDSGSTEVKKSDLFESMKVNILSTDEPSKLETADEDSGIKNYKMFSELPSVTQGNGKAEPQSVNAFHSLMNTKSSAAADRAIKIDIISQIMDKAKIFLKDGDNMIRIQLKPERLGEVFMKILVEEGKVMAKVVTESVTAKEAIETGLYQLKESLSTHGIKIDKFNVFVGDKWQEEKSQSHAGFNYKSGSGNGEGYKEHKEFNTPNASEIGASASMLNFGLYQFDAGQINFIA